MKTASLSKSFILRVLLVLVAIQALTFFVTYRLELAEMNLQLRHKIDAVGRLIAHASEKVIEESDVTDVGLLIDESLKDKDFVFFKLEDANKYAAIERKGTGGGTVDQVATFTVTKGADALGTLSIGYSVASVKKAMARRMIIKGGELLLLLVAISIVVIVLFRSK